MERRIFVFYWMELKREENVIIPFTGLEEWLSRDCQGEETALTVLGKGWAQARHRYEGRRSVRAQL